MTARPRAPLALAALAVAIASPAPAFACGLALVLAVDVSQSVDRREYALQTEGHAAAFRDPDVRRAIRAVGGISVTLVHWSGNTHQQARTPWRRLDSPESIAAFADEVGGIRRRFDIYGTALGALLERAPSAFGEEVADCARRVIDISGDGVSNTGVEVDAPRARLLAEGVTINGLVVAFQDAPARTAEEDPITFYRERVIGGPGAFSLVADGFEDYARAFREKLLREILPGVSRAPDSATPRLAGAP